MTSKLKLTARQIRKDIISMTHNAGSGHPGGSLSAADIVTALYFEVMHLNPKKPKWPDRDRFIMSKGHCCSAQYAAMARRGFFPAEELMTYRKLGSRLQGHPDMVKFPMLEASTGSLGQGLSIAVGLALGLTLDKSSSRVYCMLGDGELEEGQIWEAVMSAAHFKLDNLCAIVDANRLQQIGFNKDIKDLQPISEKFSMFGWNSLEIDGHDFKEILAAFERAAKTKAKPTVIIAHTIKGKGISFMENTKEWHGKAPDKEQFAKAMKELEDG
ncbi:MAG: transketolase [Candidatus Woesearchaeota archaeon]